MTILEILRKHQVPDACIKEVEGKLQTLSPSRKVDTRELERNGMASLKRYLKRDAARRLADAIEGFMIEKEDVDDEGKLKEIHYSLTFVREK